MMGSAPSLPAKLTQAQAYKFAGDLWDEVVFEQLAKDSKERVKRADFLASDMFVQRKQATPEQPLNTRNERIEFTDEFGRFLTTTRSAALLKEIGGGDRIREMTSLFYEKAFKDVHLDMFIASHDDPHGERLGNWIVEKMGGEGRVWTNLRPMDSRQISHHRAWNSKKRSSSQRGRPFKLWDCRVWMRIMFWSARECGLAENQAFFDWYVRFIRHFIAVYERRAPPYARQEAAWSSYPANIEKYLEAGCIMTDIDGAAQG